jgi:hypothetical protein
MTAPIDSPVRGGSCRSAAKQISPAIEPKYLSYKSIADRATKVTNTGQEIAFFACASVVNTFLILITVERATKRAIHFLRKHWQLTFATTIKNKKTHSCNNNRSHVAKQTLLKLTEIAVTIGGATTQTARQTSAVEATHAALQTHQRIAILVGEHAGTRVLTRIAEIARSTRAQRAADQTDARAVAAARIGGAARTLEALRASVALGALADRYAVLLGAQVVGL